MRVFPAVKLVMAISAPAVPGSAEAVRQANRRDVNVIGLSLPNINKPYVHDGWVQTVVLWNTRDLGYLTVLSSALLAQNGIRARHRVDRRRAPRQDSDPGHGNRPRRADDVHQGEY